MQMFIIFFVNELHCMHVTFFLCKLKVFVCKLSCYYACTYSIGHMQSLYE